MCVIYSLTHMQSKLAFSPSKNLKRSAQDAGLHDLPVTEKRLKTAEISHTPLSQILSSYTSDNCKSQEKLFSEISDAYLNRTLMRIRTKTGVHKYYRVCEIEFYLDHPEHNDTFTHGDTLQKQNCKWYFHKMNGAYKAGTYKGLDLSFGKPEINAIGGILLRSLKEVFVSEEEAGGKLKVTGNGEFIEGPCNCVNRILKETC